MKRAAALLLLYVATVDVAAQIVIVDANAGPGAAFTGLQEAVDAVPDGATLRVRPGLYAAPRVDGKGLAIVGETPGTVRLTVIYTGSLVSPEAIVLNTGPAQVTLWKDLTFIDGRSVAVAAAQGPVVFDRVVWACSSPVEWRFAQLFVVDCDNIQMTGCLMEGPGQVGGLVRSASVVARGSKLQVSNSVIRSGVDWESGAGLAGIELGDSVAWIVGSEITVSAGAGYECQPFAGCGAVAAGPAIVVKASRGPKSEITVARSLIRGGIGASGGLEGLALHLQGETTARLMGATIPGGQSVILAEPQSTVVSNPQAYPAIAALLGASRRGGTVRFAVDASPGSLALLVLGYEPNWVSLLPLSTSFLMPRYLVAFPPQSLSGSSLEVPFTIPANWPLGQTYYAQFLTLDVVSSEIWATNLMPWHTNQ